MPLSELAKIMKFIIMAEAKSEEELLDIEKKHYCKDYLVNKYTGIKVSLLINKYKTISDFFIDRHAITKLKEFFKIGNKSDSGEILNEMHEMEL
jgi:hypothetical protein